MSHCAGMTMLRYRSNQFSKRLLGGTRDRLSGLDDVGREHHGLAATDVAPVVHHAGGSEEHLARLHHPRRLPLDHQLERPFDHVAELFARMGMPARLAAGDELRTCDDGMTPVRAEVLVLHYG